MTSQTPVPTYEGRPLHDPDEPPWDQGLAFDLETLVARRQVLAGIGLGALSLGIAACGVGTGAGASATAAATGSATPSLAAATAEAREVIPEETAGPFPGDGTNGPDALSDSGVVRRDIRTSFGTGSATAEGVPLTIRFAVLDRAQACAPFAGAAIYAWHCDRDGGYSMYGAGLEGENYLRGVQAAGDDGIIEFDSFFPACYQGRWPHVHFEVYRSLEEAGDASNAIATSQIALPKATCDEVYATAGYESSPAKLAQLSLETDMVFADDGAEHQLGIVSGTVADGLVVELPVVVSV
jgi:protocatechuate 3,4-dioxygenase beta subunit